MLISIEGMDGVGKSTITKRVSKTLDIPLVEKPIDRLLCLDKEHSNIITEKIYSDYSSNVQGMYYLLGYLSALEDSKKEDIIMDRSFLSTYYFSYNEENAPLFDIIANYYGLPDLTIILYASIDERIKRIKRRNSSDVDLNKKRLYIDDYTKFFEGIKKYNMPYLVINNEKLQEEDTDLLVSTIVKLIIENKENLDNLKSIFSIENMKSISDLSIEDMIELIKNNVSNNRIKVLKREEKI